MRPARSNVTLAQRGRAHRARPAAAAGRRGGPVRRSLEELERRFTDVVGPASPGRWVLGRVAPNAAPDVRKRSFAASRSRAGMVDNKVCIDRRLLRRRPPGAARREPRRHRVPRRAAADRILSPRPRVVRPPASLRGIAPRPAAPAPRCAAPARARRSSEAGARERFSPGAALSCAPCIA